MKKLMIVTVLLSGVLASVSLFANEPLIVKEEESFIRFSGVQNKKTEFNGQFQSFKPFIVFDKDNLAASSIRVEVELSSVESGSEKRDGMLQKSNWFDIENAPQGLFESQQIQRESEGVYKVDGSLTIKGIEKPVTLFMKYVELGSLIELSGNYTLNRLDFDLGLGAWKNPDWVKHEVEVTYKVVLEQ
ncbi:YceI family protein [Kangiella sp.]|uniref:YceI family protein n=1 Tax=Kangiella sp. TaxID=1920245 RepID=UPI0019A2E85F|nr:YceI family protein [Kangiella sp.]MBD3653904.1 YceI family protein [Kangiella sp.]